MSKEKEQVYKFQNSCIKNQMYKISGYPSKRPESYTYEQIGQATSLEFSFIDIVNYDDDITKDIDDVAELIELEKFYNLKCLTLIGLDENNLLRLPRIDSLETLFISRSSITDLEGIGKFPKLKSLSIEDSKLQNLKGLDNGLLEHAVFNNCNLTSIDGINYCREIITIYAKNNALKSIPSFWVTEKLFGLDVSDNEIEEVESIAECLSLNWLKMSNNRVRDINWITPLVNLGRLEINNNKIKDVTPLKNLKNLYDLDLSDNKIVSIEPLRNLSKLNYLNLEDNNIDNMNLFLTNSFPPLEELRLANNNVDLNIIEKIKSMYEYNKGDFNEY